MKELGFRKILTKDEHFKIAGFDAILVPYNHKKAQKS